MSAPATQPSIPELHAQVRAAERASEVAEDRETAAEFEVREARRAADDARERLRVARIALSRAIGRIG